MSDTATYTPPSGGRVLVKRGIRRAHELLGDAPFFLPLQRLLTPESARDRAITERTQLVIEGFPRSGNTFASKAFTLAQDRPVVVASHVHLPAQVKLASSDEEFEEANAQKPNPFAALAGLHKGKQGR